MQKLVKRKMHYETIMPVEAYEGEEKDEVLEETYFWTLVVITTAVSTIPYVGPVAGAGLAIADHYYHDEMVDAFVAAGESELERQNIEQANHDEMHNAVVDVNEAIGDAVIDFVGNIDQNDPIVQLYGE